jgi:hypothetical protein
MASLLCAVQPHALQCKTHFDILQRTSMHTMAYLMVTAACLLHVAVLSMSQSECKVRHASRWQSQLLCLCHSSCHKLIVTMQAGSSPCNVDAEKAFFDLLHEVRRVRGHCVGLFCFSLAAVTVSAVAAFALRRNLRYNDSMTLCFSKLQRRRQ